jgi:hypothetical protein
VRQSNDWIIVRRSMPARRISAIKRRAKASGAMVSPGARGNTLVSMSNCTSWLPERFTRSKTSESFGIRVPSRGTWSGWPFA